MSVDIIYETHSWSEDNEHGIATGWLPGRLSERGRLLAAELGQRHRDDAISGVYTSDLARAVETASIAFAGTNVPIVRDARLRECNYGVLNGAPAAQVHAEQLRRLDEPFPEGESYRQVIARMDDFLADLARMREGTRVLLIGHAATRWALDHLLNEVPLEILLSAPFDWQEGWHYKVPTGYPGRSDASDGKRE